MEFFLAQHVAKKRYENSRARNLPDKKIGKQSHRETDVQGIAGEIAVAKALNIFPDFSVDDAPVADLLSPNGLWIDVKTTLYREGRLIAAPWKKPDGVDFFVLVVGEAPEFLIAGVMSSTELLRPERLKDLGHGYAYCADQSELTPFCESLLMNPSD